MKRILTLIIVLNLIAFFCPRKIRADTAMYQRCTPGENCEIGEFVFDNNGNPITSQICTIDIRNPSGTLIVDGASLTPHSDGWHSYTANIASPEGFYRALMFCNNSGETGYRDKSFYLGTNFQNVNSSIWNYSSNLGVTLATNLGKAIWEYSTRTLSSFGTLVADTWSHTTRTLSSALLGGGGQLATKTNVNEATSSAVTSIKGSSDKDLTDISGEIAGVQTTVTSIETKVDSLDTKVDTVSGNVDTIVSKWGSSSASDIIGYVDDVEGALGDNADTCAADDTIFGNIQCVRDKWGDTQTADTIYSAADSAATTATAVRSELAYNGKSTTAYEDIQTLTGYVDTLETSIGSSSDTASTATVFGRLKKAQDKLDSLDAIDTNIDTLISKWGSYKASDIYDKVKDLSSDISDINTVSNVSSILTLSQSNETKIKEIKNKVLAMKAIVDVNRILLDGVAHQPVIKTWLEEGSIIFKTLITNPSKVTTQTVPLKYYLPKEAKKEDIIKMDEDLKVEYDASREAYYISGDFELKPGKTKTFSVEVADVWQIPDDKVASLRQQADELFKPLKGTSYFAQGSTLKNDIYASLDKAVSLQKNAYTPEARIRAFREAMIEIKSAERKLEDMKTLTVSAGANGKMFGFIGGVSTVGTFGIVIVVIVGIAFLGILFKQLFANKTIKRSTRFKAEKLKNRFGKIKEKYKLIIFVVLAFGAVILGVNLLRGGRMDSSPTTASSPTPAPAEKKVLGAKIDEEIMVVVPAGANGVNIRKEPSLNSEILTRFWLSKKVNKIGEKGDWVKIEIEVEKDGVKYSEGWVNKDLVEEVHPVK